MVDMLPFIQLITFPGSTEADALLGFSFPFLPDMLTSPWFVGANEQERLYEALRLQVSMIKSFWSIGVAAWDLRFVGTNDMPGISTGLLCRLRRPQHVQQRLFHEYCLSFSRRLQQMFADYGYEVEPLVDEQSLFRYLKPFDFQSLAEIRKYEELLIAEDEYTEYEFYVTYPWHWSIQNRLRLFEAMLQRQSNCLVSIYLEPTHLNPQEQSHLNHATSMQMRDLLMRCGPNGQTVYKIYQHYARNLRQPYLLRSSIAASAPQTLRQVGSIFLDELNAPQLLEPTSRELLREFTTSQTSGTRAVLEYPQSSQEWYLALRCLSNLECISWGTNRGLDLPGTARLRYLADENAASMAFRLPVVGYKDLAGVPVRSIPPGMGTQPKPFASDSYVSSNPIIPATVPTPVPGTSGSEISANIGAPESSNIQKPEDLIGKTLGSCQIEALLGQGGFGAVYRARQQHLNRLVAVKIVLAAISNSDFHRRHKMALRFDREALALAKLDHPHILMLYEYRSEPLPYIVMPYMAGGSLADEIKSSGSRALSPDGVAIILNQVASALDYAHHQRLTHRDIKPRNLLRHADGRIILSDFGIVQYEDDDLTALTTDQQVSPFTPAYASPEQQLGQKVDFRSDIYSLGIVIYELLCGQRPFKQPFEHINSPLPPMHTFGIQVRPALEAVVSKALAKQPEQRYQSAGEMAREFQSALSSK
jgi:Protein kinase domain